MATFEEPPQCMPDQYKVPGCSVTAYWNYYEQEKHTVASQTEHLILRPWQEENYITTLLVPISSALGLKLKILLNQGWQ